MSRHVIALVDASVRDLSRRRPGLDNDRQVRQELAGTWQVARVNSRSPAPARALTIEDKGKTTLTLKPEGSNNQNTGPAVYERMK